jgi:electron transfer flavoprotein alpha subunit
MTTVLVIVEHDRGSISPATFEAATAARTIGSDIAALAIGADARALADPLRRTGVDRIHVVEHELLDDYAPEAWGEVAAHAITELDPDVVIAAGTDRGNEVMAHTAARLDLPFAANCMDIAIGESVDVTRVRWGGSLFESAGISAPTTLLTVAHHHFDATEVDGAAPELTELTVELDPKLARTKVAARVEREAGVTLATAPVVVGGGRGVGSADAFEPLEELAGLLGGVVGCSRAVTNNGWRNHADQVGQTGTRIAPDVYFACGISGAIQHWVGAMASKHIIAINTDEQANMVTRAGYAVIADLHEVVPAISEEIRRRR